MRTPKPRVSKDQAAKEPAGKPTLLLDGALAEKVEVIGATSIALTGAIGELSPASGADSYSVLVPFAHIRLESKKEGEAIFNCMVTYENFAFVLKELCGDMNDVTKGLRKMARDELPVRAERVEAVKRYVDKALRSLNACRQELDDVARTSNT